MSEEESTPENKPLPFKKDEDFTSLYANNVVFRASAWDLQMVFGELDQSDPNQAVVVQHTGMSLAWPTAKVTAYHLIAQVIAHQAQMGLIPLRQDTIPPRPDSSSPTLQPQDRPAAEYIAWMHDQFFGPNPYVPPSVRRAQEQLAAEQQQPTT